MVPKQAGPKKERISGHYLCKNSFKKIKKKKKRLIGKIYITSQE